jgi:hypothetical protein
MGSRKEYPVPFVPKGLTDAWEATDAFAGACLLLQNLIFDQTHASILTARPGVVKETSFATFTTPTGVTVYKVLGNVVYGMVSTARNAGKDEPFAYDMAAHAFIVISGVTNANTPTTQATSGDWTPPTMAVVGVKILVTHPGFNGAGANFFGVIDITNPAAPAWSDTNTTVNLLPSAPTSVANYNNRAYFACGNKEFYSDVLAPTVMTNAGQSLTLGDNTVITGQAGLPIQTTSAGVIGGLIVFKGSQIWQITGDAAVAGTLSENWLSLTVGCSAPRTIVQTPLGIIFIAVDGPYYISATGQVLPLTKRFDSLISDLQIPFINISNPTRAAAAYSSSIYRVCLQTVADGVPVVNDYWFDVTDRRWSGPHTFSYDCADQFGNAFIVSYIANGAKLYVSQSLNTLTSVYTDDGSSYTLHLRTSLLPKTQNINMKAVIESTIELSSLAPSTTYTISALDENFNQIDQLGITIISGEALYDGGSTYDSGVLYSTGTTSPATYNIPWTQPIVFKKIALDVLMVSGDQTSIGTAFFKYRDLGYTNVR